MASDEYVEELECALRAARAAGDLVRPAFHAGYAKRVDAVAEECISELLLAAFPAYGYLGEELGTRAEPRESRQHVWLVDPHDGTRAAVEGFRGAAVSIALLRDGELVLGVVFAYSAPDDNGDLFYWRRGMAGIGRNGVELRRHWAEGASSEMVAVISQHADEKPLTNHILLSPLRYRRVPGIAYRLALVAAGEAEVGISLNAPTSWDVAGGHALLLGAGGDLFDESGQAVRYLRSGRLKKAIQNCFGGSTANCLLLAQRAWSRVLGHHAEAGASGVLAYLKPGRTIQEANVLARAQGCLLGQFAGDALGSLVEF